MRSKPVAPENMTKEKQLERALEIFSNATMLNLNDLIFMANAEQTKYIVYGLKN